jgi:hypothetical protein
MGAPKKADWREARFSCSCQPQQVSTLFTKDKDVLSKFSDRLYAWAKGRLILLILIVIVLFLGLTEALFQAFSDPTLADKVSLDSRFLYTPETAFAAVASYGDAGRIRMIWIHLVWDFIFPVLYTAFLSLFMSWLFQRGFRPGSRLRKLNVVAVAGGCFDLLENVGIVTMILVYPAQPAVVAWLSTIFSMGKGSCGVVIILLLLIGLVKAAMNRFKVQPVVTIGG